MKKSRKQNLSLIITLLVLAIAVAAIIIFYPKSAECTSDSDCMPSACCHPISCVSTDKAPNCEGMFCTMNCQSDSMDCGQGSCGCIEGQCSVNWKLK